MSKTEAIKLSDRTTVYLTAKAQSVRSGARKAGDAVSLHPKQAEAWLAAGKATDKPNGKTSKTAEV